MFIRSILLDEHAQLCRGSNKIHLHLVSFIYQIKLKHCNNPSRIIQQSVVNRWLLYIDCHTKLNLSSFSMFNARECIFISDCYTFLLKYMPLVIYLQGLSLEYLDY